jgi:hypothetical protein
VSVPTAEIHDEDDNTYDYPYHLVLVPLFVLDRLIGLAIRFASHFVLHDPVHLFVDAAVVHAVAHADQNPNDNPDASSGDAEQKVENVVSLFLLVGEDEQLIIHGYILLLTIQPMGWIQMAIIMTEPIALQQCVA